MTTTVLRTRGSWWVEVDSRAYPVGTAATTTAGLLADRAALDKALANVSGAASVAISELGLVSPVTTPCRVVAQMVNYRSHALDTGFDPTKVSPTFFRKASGSVSGPFDPIVRPPHVRLLDYEVELGLVLGADLPLDTEVTDAELARYIAGLVVTNDVSARDVQLTKGQFYESKSYPTFTPVGPRLVLVGPDELARLTDLRLTLGVDGETRQDALATEMIVQPAKALTLLARFQALSAGDLLLTGTPGGTALKAPPKIIEKVGALLPPERKWKTFFARQAKNPAYLQAGQTVAVRIATDDGALDLGTQRTVIV
ncbi:fumarylacetoacetate (FAA) hydrolase [Parafrankia sp. EAN1pec]|uniref:fumarylacetoacetate hydrolase family protein n=1 Tax=Parafrankia sp. (strain EAN1pec) TaxID=298653 RepID=UPI0000542877|nr:fumarylacetoacetate (FAA) hydrolase [Frankia sp. EAN1pec]